MAARCCLTVGLEWGQHELLDIAGDVNGLDVFQPDFFVFAPGGKLRDRHEVCLARIPIANVGCEEFPETFAAVLGAQEDGRQRSAGGGAQSRQPRKAVALGCATPNP